MKVLVNPVNHARDPEAYDRAERVLEAVFENAPEDVVFIGWILRNIGQRKASLLRARYDAWKEKRSA